MPEKKHERRPPVPSTPTGDLNDLLDGRLPAAADAISHAAQAVAVAAKASARLPDSRQGFARQTAAGVGHALEGRHRGARSGRAPVVASARLARQARARDGSRHRAQAVGGGGGGGASAGRAQGLSSGGRRAAAPAACLCGAVCGPRRGGTTPPRAAHRSAHATAEAAAARPVLPQKPRPAKALTNLAWQV